MKIEIKNKPILNIIVALPCEARPIISFYKLKKMPINPFPIFTNNDQTIYLIEAGIGKVKIAAATTFLYTLTGSQNHACFLNVGIAGSTQFSIGRPVLANKIIEHSTQRCWYPFIAPLKNQNQTSLITHDLPQKDYPEVGMIDMEGSAFFQTAAHFVTQEQIQVLKFISDNNTSSLNQINAVLVSDLITKNMHEIDILTNYLLQLSLQEKSLEFDTDWIAQFKEKWHFTHSQLLQLKEYLRKWHVIHGDKNPFLICENSQNASQVFEKINLQLFN